MPKLIKEKQWLLNSAIVFNNYPTRKIRKTRNSLTTKKVEKERKVVRTTEEDLQIILEQILSEKEKEIPIKYEVVKIKDKNWAYIRKINSQIKREMKWK